MKKLLMAIVLLPMMAGANTWTDESTGYTWYYNVSGGKAEIRNSYSCAVSPKPSGALEIPSQINGYPVGSIGYAAFRYCSELSSVKIPSGVTSIGDWAFYDCGGLTSVAIPSSVTNIGESAFHGCDGLTSFVVADDNVSYSSHDGLFYNKTKTELIQCPASKQGVVVIPAGVTSIGRYAFYGCDSVTEIEIPQGVTNIGEYAFCDCRELTSVTIPPSVTSIGNWAFEYCNKLQGVYITDLAAWWKIQFSGYSANPLCCAKKLYCNGAEVSEAVVPDGMTSIGNYAFYGCETLVSVTISEGVTNIGGSAFCGCCAISAITIPQGVVSIGSRAFSGCAGAMSVTIPSSVKVIASESFYGCAKLDSVVIPEGVERIEYSAFSGCSKLTAVTIPQSMMRVESNAFAGCTSVRQVTAVSLADWMSIDFAYIQANPCWCGADLRFNNSYLSSNLILPEGLTRIDEATFAGCENLTSVYIPSSVTYIASSAFSGCKSLSAIRVDPSNLHYASIDGILYDKGLSYLEVCPNGYQGILTIPASVTSVPYDDFGACTRMTSIDVAEGNDRFGSKNGLLCSRDGRTVMACPGGMSDLVLPDNISDVYYGAFSKCTNLRRVTVPASMTTIPSGAFQDCRSLKELIIQSGVLKVSDSAFSGCVGLTAVSIPQSVQAIGRYVFKGCEGLKEISVPFVGTQRGSGERFYSIFGYSGDVPEKLATVTLTDEVTIPNHAFEGCKYIRTITLPIGVSSIGDSAFRGCESLNAISLPAGIAKIGSSAFYGCSSLSEVVVPVGVPSIESSTFYGCTSLRRVTLPVGLTEIGYSAFRDCRSLVQINIPNTVSAIGSGAFDGCSGLGSGVVVVDRCLLTVNGNCPADVIIGKDVRLIVGGAFSECESVQSVTIKAQIEELPDDLFEYCSNLKKVVLPASLRVIGDYAFYRCCSLDDIQLPEGLIEIREGAFARCSSIQTFNIPASVTRLCSLPTGRWEDDDSDDEIWIPSKLSKLTVASGNKVYAAYNNILYSKSGRILIWCLPTASSISIRSGTEYIVDGAFQGCSKLTQLVIPEGVVAMDDLWDYFDEDYPDDYAALLDEWGDVPDLGCWEDGGLFYGCSSLKALSLPSTLAYIGEYALKDLPALSSLTVATGNKQYAAYDNVLYDKVEKKLLLCPQALRQVKIWEKTESIASCAFEDCDKLESLTIPASVKKIGTSPFCGCENLRAVYYKGDAPFPLLWTNVCGYCGQEFPSDSWTDVDEEEAAEIQNTWELYVLNRYWGGSCSGESEIEYLDVTSYVQKGTKWWGDSGEWQGRPLVFVDNIENSVVKYVLSFDPCGGESPVDQVENESGAAVGTLPTATREGYEFLGWFTSTIGGTQVTAATIVTKDVTFYAHWRRIGGDPVLVDEAETMIDATQGEVAPYETAATVYDGTLVDANGVVKGTVQVKVAKMKNGAAKVTATVQLAGSTKKISFKGGIADEHGNVSGLTAAGHALNISLGVDGMGGLMDGKSVDGARNVFSAKDAGSKALAKAIENAWVGAVNVVGDGVVLNVTIAKKGKVKVSGTVNGAKVSASSQLLVGADACCVPVVITKKANLAFNLWLMDDGSVTVVGLDGAIAGKAKALRAGARIWMNDAEAALGAGGVRALPYLPDWLSVAQSGTKWIVAGGAKAGKLVLLKGTSDIDPAKSKITDNMSGLKLTYKAKDGSFKGSFKAYNLENGKLKAYTVNVTGVMVGDTGYGTATLKKPAASWPITIE